MLKPYKKEFDIQITQANATVKQTFEVDKSVKNLCAVMLVSNRPDLIVYRGSLRLEINKEEILPDGFSASRLFSGIVVKPNDRPYDIGKNPAGNGLIKIEYTDADDGRTIFAAHTVTLCVDGEREDTV
jgi:hypothetical protein